MKARTKIVELSGQRFSLRRLPPIVGSFVFRRLLSVSLRQADDQPSPKKSKRQAVKSEPQITGETRVRALSFVALGAIAFDDFEFIQTHCMRVVDRITHHGGIEAPIPVMTDNGTWADEDLSEDTGLVTQLTTEVLVFCFSDFFDQSVVTVS